MLTHDDHLNGWKMLVGGNFWPVVITLPVLGIAALLKYLRSGPK